MSETLLKISSVYCALSIILVAMVFIGFSISLQYQIFLLLIGSVIVGLPHGALDMDIALQLGLANRGLRGFLFFLSYIVIAFLNFLVWINYPTVGFTFFLLLSMFHFGEDWDGDIKFLKPLTFGVGFLSFPAILHDENIINLFSIFITTDDSLILVHILKTIAPFFLASSAFFLLRSIFLGKIIEATLIFSFLISSIILEPVLFLACYFCLYHGPKHTFEIYDWFSEKTSKSIILRHVILSLVTLCLLLITFLYFSKDYVLNDALFSSVIILIACLTTPHMILIAYKNYVSKV